MGCASSKPEVADELSHAKPQQPTDVGRATLTATQLQAQQTITPKGGKGELLGEGGRLVVRLPFK
jgi:hypothetical protein